MWGGGESESESKSESRRAGTRARERKREEKFISNITNSISFLLHCCSQANIVIYDMYT